MMASYGVFPSTKIYLINKVQKCELVPNVVSKLHIFLFGVHILLTKPKVLNKVVERKKEGIPNF